MLRSRDLPFLAAVSIAIYFAVLAWPGLTMHFAPDDMQNLYTYWSRGTGRLLSALVLFATSFYRPMGGVFYLPMFKLFGFHPLPYRIAIFLLLWVNLWLFYALTRRVAGSREIAAFAVLFGCFHANAVGVYMSNSILYEVLCFAFLIGALLYYVRIRRLGGVLSPRELAVLALLFIAALDSKEMAAVFPAILVVYEILYHAWNRPSLPRVAPLAIAGIMSALYLAGKLFGAETLTRIDAYRPVYTIARFLETSSVYLGALFLSDKPFTPPAVILFWLALFALAGLLRRKNMLFGAAFSFLAFLPLNFVPPREGFVLYIPLVGFSLYAADLLILILDRVQVLFKMSRQHRTQLASVAFILCMALLGEAHADRATELAGAMRHAQEQTWSILQQFEQMHPRVQPGARILLADSPIANDWDIYFIAKLYFRDPSLRAAWVRSSNPVIYGDVHDHFDHEFRFNGDRLLQTK